MSKRIAHRKNFAQLIDSGSERPQFADDQKFVAVPSMEKHAARPIKQDPHIKGDSHVYRDRANAVMVALNRDRVKFAAGVLQNRKKCLSGTTTPSFNLNVWFSRTCVRSTEAPIQLV